MRGLLAIGVLAVLAIVAFSRVTGPAVGPDTPVIVHSADPIKVILPANPDAKTISGYVYGAISEVAKRHSGDLERDLRAMADDGELMSWIADGGASRFASDQAAALAYPIYRVNVQPEYVSITTATVELLPQYWNIGKSIAHEDGHATINRILAEKCGKVLVAEYATTGRRGGVLARTIEQALYDLGDDAHGLYHAAVNGNRSPAFDRAARAAADDVIASRC